MVKNPAANAGDIRAIGSIPGSESPLEEGMAPRSSTLAWRISWTEQSGGLQSIGWHRVRHDRSDLAQSRPSISASSEFIGTQGHLYNFVI